MKTYKMHKRILAFGLAVAMILSGLQYSDKQVEAAEPDVKFGVISDTHLTEAESDWKRQETLTRALTYYKEQGVSLIAVNADIVDLGEDAAYTKFNTIWNEVFTDTATAPKLLVTADNHEYYKAWVMSGQTAEETVAEAQTRFKTAFGLDSIHNVVVDSGYYFIGVSSDAATDDSGYQKSGVAYYSTETLEWLTGQLDAAKSADATKPIYLFIHQPAEGTVPNGEAIPENLKNLLSNYPQIVLFTSHTHLPLEDECQIYQEDYTIVNTSAIYERQQGLMVSTTGTSTEIQRCDFSGDTVKQIKDNWIIATPADTSTYTYTVDKRNTAAVAPTFAEGTVVTTTPYANNRIKVTFPAAVPSENWPSDFVYEYEVAVKDAEGTVVSSDKSWADFVNNTSDSNVTKDVSRVMRLESDMADGAEYSIEVKAYDSLGNASAAITGTYTHETIDIDTIVEPALRQADGNCETKFYFNVNAEDDNLADDASWYLRIEAVKGGIYKNNELLDACIVKTGVNSDGTNTYMLFLSGGGKTDYTAEEGDVVILSGVFEPYNFGSWLTNNPDYVGHTFEIKECYFLYHGADKGWEQLDSLDDYLSANELTVKDATLKMGGEYGDGAYYDLKASFTGPNWILNEISAPQTNITFEYTALRETWGASGLYGVVRSEKTDSNYASNNGLLNYISNGATNTYVTSQGANVKVMYDYDNHTPEPARTPITTYTYTNATYKVDDVAYTYEEFDTKYNPGYFGLGFTGAYDVDFTKVLMYDGDNNALGLQSYNNYARTSWDVRLMADYGATVYVKPADKTGYAAVGLKILGRNNAEVQTTITECNNGVWSFVMNDKIVSVEPIYAAATANKITVANGTVKMGGDYGDGAYYDLKASFSGNNWIINTTSAPKTDITMEYTVNNETRATGGMYGLFRAEANNGLTNYKYGLMNYLTSGTTTYSPTDGTVTLMYDYSEHKPIPFQARVYTGGFTSKKGTAYVAASNATDTVAKYTQFDNESDPGYFGLGWYGGTYEIDFTKVMMYDGENNDLGISSNTTTNCSAWECTLMADYGATIYILPDKQEGQIATGLKFFNASGEEVNVTATVDENGVWSFVMIADVVSIEPIYESAASLAGNSVTLEGTLDANYYMEIPADIDVETADVSMSFTLSGNTESVTDCVYDEEKGAYKFTYGVPAKHMTDTIQAQLFVGDTARSEVYEFTIQDYANTLLNDETQSEEIKALVTNMLHYGAYTQSYFGYNTVKPANDGLDTLDLTSVTQNTFASYATTSANINVKATGFGTIVASNLYLKAETSLKLYIQLDVGVSVDDYTFKYGDGVLEQGTYGDWITVTIPNIAAHDLDEIFTITVTKDTESYEFKYGVFTYAYNALDENYTTTTSIKDLVKVMYKYNEAANSAISSN